MHLKPDNRPTALLLKTVTLTVIILLTCGRLFAQQDTTTPLTLTLALQKEYKVRITTQNLEHSIKSCLTADSIYETQYNVTATLKNNTRQSIFIWLMTCSYDMNFQVNNNYSWIMPWPCDSNFPYLVEFKPGESKTYQFTLDKSVKFEHPCGVYGEQVEETRLGLILIDDLFKPRLDAFVGYHLAMEDKSRWKMLWSNPLYLLTKEEAHPAPAIFGVDKPKE